MDISLAEMRAEITKSTIPDGSSGMNAVNGTFVGPRLHARKNVQISMAMRTVMTLAVRAREISGMFF
jgi:hypothetical protein